MSSFVLWKAPTTASHPARDAALASYDAVCRKAKEEWLDLFAEDGWIEDPIGPSFFDATGAGHHGRAGRAAFWDLAIAGVDTFVFEITDSFAAGSECANVGTIHTTLADGTTVHTEGVFVYRVDGEGKVMSLRAFWEIDRAMATMEPADRR